MLRLGVGEIGLNVEDFYNLTFDEFAAISEGYADKREYEKRLSWEQSRFIAYFCFKPHYPKTLSATDLVTFQWEKDVKAEQIKQLKKEDFSMFPSTIKE